MIHQSSFINFKTHIDKELKINWCIGHLWKRYRQIRIVSSSDIILLYEIAPQHIGSNFQREKTDEMFFISELNAPRLRITPCIWLRAIALHPNFALAKLQIHIKSEIAPTI